MGEGKLGQYGQNLNARPSPSLTTVPGQPPGHLAVSHRPLHPRPKERQCRRVQVGLFTNYTMSRRFLRLVPFSAFVGRGGR